MGDEYVSMQHISVYIRDNMLTLTKNDAGQNIYLSFHVT